MTKIKSIKIKVPVKVEQSNDIARSFHLSKTQNEKFEKWRKKLPKKDYGTIGGGYQFIFEPNGIGTVVTVKRADGKQLDLTEDNW